MKKLLLLTMILVSMVTNAQKDVTKFLGIPVDGTKSDMIIKLKAKGFKYNQQQDILTGEFNGYNVKLLIATYNNTVWRIAVVDAIDVSETDIRIRFNNLCGQFERNGKYVPYGGKDFSIPEEEDISYNMSVKNIRYEAVYLQLSKDKNKIKDEITDKLRNKYSDDDFNDPAKKEEIEEVAYNEASKVISELYDPNKSVWFLINERFGRYSITMYYDNEYNHSDGEDL